jgi:hypothetical protein
MSKFDVSVIDPENCHFTSQNRVFSSSSYGIEIIASVKSAHESWHDVFGRVRAVHKVLSTRALALRSSAGNSIA